MMGKGGFINLPHPSFLWHFTMYWLLVPPIARSRKCAGMKHLSSKMAVLLGE